MLPPFAGEEPNRAAPRVPAQWPGPALDYFRGDWVAERDGQIIRDGLEGARVPGHVPCVSEGGPLDEVPGRGRRLPGLPEPRAGVQPVLQNLDGGLPEPPAVQEGALDCEGKLEDAERGAGLRKGRPESRASAGTNPAGGQLLQVI